MVQGGYHKSPYMIASAILGSLALATIGIVPQSMLSVGMLGTQLSVASSGFQNDPVQCPACACCLLKSETEKETSSIIKRSLGLGQNRLIRLKFTICSCHWYQERFPYIRLYFDVGLFQCCSKNIRFERTQTYTGHNIVLGREQSPGLSCASS